MSRSVVIGPEFFQNTKNDYSNVPFAFCRELQQNSQDALGCTKIEVTTSYDDKDTVIIWRNNGEPMTEDILVNKFLSLGESGKRFQGTVGGFGAAKLLIAFMWKAWEIRTGVCYAHGSGGNYELESQSYFHGTETKITMSGHEEQKIKDALRNLASMTQWSGTLTLNGEVLDTNLHKGSRRRDFDWGIIYTNNSHPCRLIVRSGGLPMFSRPIAHRGTVLVELNSTSQVLASNRDSLKYNAQYELDNFVNEVAVNTKSAFKDRNKKTETVKFPGYKLHGYEDVSLGRAIKVSAQEEWDSNEREFIPTVIAALVANTNAVQDPKDTKLTVEKVNQIFRPEFYLKSEVGGTIPSRFLPHSFSANSRRLISSWISLLVELASLTKLDKSFSVGFIFDKDSLAQYEREGDRHVVYINPAKLIQETGKARQLHTRWKFDAAGNWELLATAVHEFCHLEGYGRHDQDYANRLTDLMSLVLANRARFSKYFSMPSCWPESKV